MRVMKRLAFNGKVRLSMARQLYSGPHSFFFFTGKSPTGCLFQYRSALPFWFFF